MTPATPSIPRLALVECVERHLAQASSVIVLGGAAGVGKTTVLRTVAQRAAHSGWSTVWVGGSPALAAIPYGALLHHLPPDGGAGNLDAFLDAVLPRGGPKGTLFALDDAQWIDQASLELIGRRLVEGSCQIVATARPGSTVPIGTGGHTVVDVPPMARTEVQVLIEALLGAPPEPSLRAAIWSGSQGNPMLVHEMVRALLDRGRLVISPAAAGLLPGTDLDDLDTSTLLRERIAGLPAPLRRLVQLVALAGTLSTRELGHAAPRDVVDLLLGSDLVVVDGAAGSHDVRIAHRSLEAAVRASLGSIERHERLEELIDLHRRPSTPHGRTRLLRWRLAAGHEPSPLEAADVVRDAAASGDHELVHRFGPAALAVDDRPRMHLLVGIAALATGHPEEAARHYRDAEAGCEDAVLLAEILVHRTRLLDLSPGEAKRRIGAAVAAVADPVDRRRAVERSAWAVAAVLRVDRSAATPGAGPEPADLPAHVEPLRLMVLTHQARLIDVVESTARRADGAADTDRLEWELTRNMLTSIALAFQGQVAAALGRAEVDFERARIGHLLDLEGWSASAAGLACDRSAQFEEALSWYRACLAVTPRANGRYPLAAGLVLELSVLAGTPAPAGLGIDAPGSEPNDLGAGRRARAAGWSARAAGQDRASVAHAVRAGLEPLRRAQLDLWLMEVLEVLSVMGLATDHELDEFDDLVQRAGGTTLPLELAIGRALHAGDAGAAAQAADQLATAGARWFASLGLEAAGLHAHEHGGGRRVAVDLLDRSRRLAVASRLPMDLLPPRPAFLHLTGRERMIIDRAVERRQNADIAEELGISVRTVENLRSRAYDKLNVRSHHDLEGLAT